MIIYNYFSIKRINRNGGTSVKIAFIIWSIVAVIFFIMGLIDRKSDKPVGFWANAKVSEIENIPEYNNAVAKIWFVFAVVLELLGIPLIFIKQNSPIIMFLVIGMMFLIIVIMVVYTKVEDKYRKKK